MIAHETIFEMHRRLIAADRVWLIGTPSQDAQPDSSNSPYGL